MSALSLSANYLREWLHVPNRVCSRCKLLAPMHLLSFIVVQVQVDVDNGFQAHCFPESVVDILLRAIPTACGTCVGLTHRRRLGAVLALLMNFQLEDIQSALPLFDFRHTHRRKAAYDAATRRTSWYIF